MGEEVQVSAGYDKDKNGPYRSVIFFGRHLVVGSKLHDKREGAEQAAIDARNAIWDLMGDVSVRENDFDYPPHNQVTCASMEDNSSPPDKSVIH